MDSLATALANSTKTPPASHQKIDLAFEDLRFESVRTGSQGDEARALGVALGCLDQQPLQDRRVINDLGSCVFHATGRV